MTRISIDHVCEDADCPHIGQRTFPGCKCHKTREQMLEGIDPPQNAPEDWQPSLLECIRHAEIAIAFDERNAKPTPARPLARWDDAKRYTPAQMQQVMVLRKNHLTQRNRGTP